MKKLFFTSIIAFAILFSGCSKNADQFTIQEYESEQNYEIKEKIKQDLSLEDQELFKNAYSRLKETKGIDTLKDKTVRDIITLQSKYNQELELYKEPYRMAIDSLKDVLKYPNSARFTSLSLENSDSLKFSFNEDSTSLSIKVKYEAQNAYGTYKADHFRMSFLKEEGEWKPDTRVYMLYVTNPVLLIKAGMNTKDIEEELNKENVKYNKLEDANQITYDCQNLSFEFQNTKYAKFICTNGILDKAIFSVERGDLLVDSYERISKPGQYIDEGDGYRLFSDGKFYIGKSGSTYAEFIFDYN